MIDAFLGATPLTHALQDELLENLQFKIRQIEALLPPDQLARAEQETQRREGVRQEFKSAESLLRSDFCGDATQRFPLSSSINEMLKNSSSLPRELSSMLQRLHERAGSLEEVLQGLENRYEVLVHLLPLSSLVNIVAKPDPPRRPNRQLSTYLKTGMFLRIHNL